MHLFLSSSFRLIPLLPLHALNLGCPLMIPFSLLQVLLDELVNLHVPILEGRAATCGASSMGSGIDGIRNGMDSGIVTSLSCSHLMSSDFVSASSLAIVTKSRTSFSLSPSRAPLASFTTSSNCKQRKGATNEVSSNGRWCLLALAMRELNSLASTARD